MIVLVQTSEKTHVALTLNDTLRSCTLNIKGYRKKNPARI